jgi:transcriptional regulator with XRE-family HTH domain
MLEELGARLREERLRLTLDQTSFGQLGGVKKNSQINYEAGRTAPDAEYLLKLEEHGVDPGYVLTGRRESGELSFENKQLLDMFGRLSAREREAVMSMLMILSGNVIDASDLSKRGLGSKGGALHSGARSYNAERPGE